MGASMPGQAMCLIPTATRVGKGRAQLTDARSFRTAVPGATGAGPRISAREMGFEDGDP